MSSKKGVPHVVTVTVYGAKGLKPKKDKHKFCVIFGIGRSKYRTDVVEDLFDNPVFNKEAEITVDNLDLELKFKVTEKNEKDVLGQVIVPLYELGTQSTSSPHKVPLRPHKKCPTPHGTLVFEAWLTEKTVVEKVASRSLSLDNLKSIKSIGIASGLKKLKERISVPAKPLPTDEKQKKSSSESLFSLKARSAVSCQDMTRESHFYIPGDRHSLHSVSSEPSDFLDAISELPSSKRSSLYLDKVSEFSCPRPEVTSVSPKSGPETGGTVLTIRGSNLGQNAEDIVVLNVCGSDVLATLEYISPWKLQCRTLPWNPCAGNISVETFSGGRGTSLVEFDFTEVERPKFPTANSPGSYSPQTSLPDIYEENRYEVDDQSNSNEEYGIAIPYSDSEAQNSFQVDELDSKQSSAYATPSDTGSRIFSGEDGVIRLSVGGNDLEFPDNQPDTTLALETPSLDGKTTNGIYLAQDSNSVRDQDYNDGNSEDELVTRVEINRTKIPAQSGFPSAVESSAGPEKSDGRTVTASNGAPVKLPPPVVEIQPMRMEDNHAGAPQGKGSGGNPPQKPPRQFSGRQNSGGQSSFDHTTLSSDLERSVDQDDLFPERRTNKENEQIKDLEMQLLKKTYEVDMLLKMNNSLTDENWRLKQYVEALVMRAIKVCPEVLCIDDSFA